ncbi:MAG: ABC transporter ATP-binding protein [Planctomycetes bacterium]|nr:ABC transporter ATP-binding protein [Planctomycetota bacterium]
MIELQQVCRSYGDKVAVANLNLRVAAGELYSMLGHNGAGKTTAIKLLVGLIRPTSGTIHVGGYDVVTQTREAAALIGYVPDQPFLYDKLSGREILQFVSRMYGMDGRQSARAIDREIERFELAEFADQLTETYSHGMKQRTVFASALLHAPRVLVVDEPMVGLDPHSIRLVKDLLKREVAGGMCVLMSTHTLTAAEEISHRVGIMNQGRLMFDGTVAELRGQFPGESRSLESMYLALTEADSNAPQAFSRRSSASIPAEEGLTR